MQEAQRSKGRAETMLLRAMIRYCRGTVHFAVSGPYPERFLNLCAQGGLGLWNVRQQPGGLSACCALSHRRQLEYYARKSGLTLTVTKCAGMHAILGQGVGNLRRGKALQSGHLHLPHKLPHHQQAHRQQP